MVARNPNTLEPLLVPTLRLLVALPLTVILVQVCLGYLLPLVPLGFGLVPPQTLPYGAIMPFVIAQLLTMFLLGMPWGAAWLGRSFLPLTLFFCTAGPVSTFLLLMFRFQGTVLSSAIFPESAAYGLQGIVPMLFFLMIPLIVIAWQYSFRQVVLYALSLALVNVGTGVTVKLLGGVDIVWILFQFSIGSTVIFTATGYLVSRLVASQRQQRAALAQANAQLVQYALTQEQLTLSRERNRLARDLHDTLAHYMSGLVLELEGVRLLWDVDTPQARTTLDNAIGTARTGLTETRHALQALRATPLTDLGLAGALRDLAETTAARNQWQLHLDLPTTSLLLSPTVDEVIYRVIQEGLTNSERHAEATTINLTVASKDDWIKVMLEDDGCGFDTAAVNRAEHFGLLGMQERSGLVGGALAIASTPGRGTVITLTFNEKSRPHGLLGPVPPASVNGKIEGSR